MNPRKHQIENYELALAAKEHPRVVVNVVTTGGGKSAIPPIYAVTLIPHTLDKLCWVVPRESLRRQAEEAFNAQWLREWLNGMRQVRAAVNDVDPSRGTSGYVTTYQAIAQSPDLHRHEFERFRYGLVLDEVHHVEVDSLWHRALQPLVDRAELLILMTGTLERGDGKQIAFLEYQPNAKGRLEPDISETETRASVRYNRSDALAERAIIPITFKHYDLSGSWVDRGGHHVTVQSFDEVDDEQSGDALYAGLGTQYAFELLCDCARDWRAYSVTHPSSRLLVVAHRQHAAKAYVKELRDRFGIRAGVAVSEDGAEAQGVIRRFRHGQLDALVTVGMAYEGLDVPGITHLACLTHIRSKPWIEQMFGRAVRVDPDAGPWHQQAAYAYVPDDPLMGEVIDRIRLEQAPYVVREREDGFVGVGETAVPPPLGGIVALAGTVSGLRTSELDGDAMSQSETAQYQRVLDRFGFTGLMTPLDLRRLLAGAPAVLAEPQGARPHTETTYSADEEALRRSIQKVCNVIDARLGRDHGTTNREVRLRFDKPRDEMLVTELQAVWAYLNDRYPELVS